VKFEETFPFDGDIRTRKIFCFLPKTFCVMQGSIVRKRITFWFEYITLTQRYQVYQRYNKTNTKWVDIAVNDIYLRVSV